MTDRGARDGPRAYSGRVSVNPPFRADIVGSFLRPEALKQARAAAAAGAIDAAALRAVEDDAIADLVRRQRDHGLQPVTDGEFRRSWWHFDFFGMLEGVDIVELDHGIQFQGVQTTPRGVHLGGRIGFSDAHPMLAHYRALHALAAGTGATPKFAIPAPTVLDFRLESDHLGDYVDRDAYVDDLVQAYRDALAAFYDAGCRYLQLDDTAWAYLCSEVELGKAAERGIRTDGLADRYAGILNRVLADKPADLTVTTHVCRGNFRSTWISSGGYEPVAEQLLGEVAYDGYFLEFDDDRSGGFEPLRFLPEGEKTVVLGLVTTKTGALEDHSAIAARIEEAASFVRLEQLALSPQCGFASTEEGNALSEDEQWAKIDEVVAIAADVWA